MNLKFFLYKFSKAMISTLIVTIILQLFYVFYGDSQKKAIDNIIGLFIMLLFYKYYSLKEKTVDKDEIFILNSKTARNIEQANVKFNDKFYEILVFHSFNDFSKIEDVRFVNKMPSLKEKEKMIKALERLYQDER